MKKQRLFIDVDGVLADFTLGVANRVGLKEHELVSGNLTLYKDMFDFQTHAEMMEEINFPGFWRHLPRTKFAQELLARLIALRANPNLDLDFSFLSALPTEGHSQAPIERKHWLIDLWEDTVQMIQDPESVESLEGIEYYDFQLKFPGLIIDADKSSYCLNKQRDILFDDYEKNVEAWKDKGGLALLLPSRNNTRSDEQDFLLDVVDDFIYQQLLK